MMKRGPYPLQDRFERRERAERAARLLAEGRRIDRCLYAVCALVAAFSLFVLVRWVFG